MTRHEIKAWPWEFGRIVDGGRATVRLNDRRFQIGDEVLINEYDFREKKLTGRKVEFTLCFVQPVDVKRYWPDGFNEETYLYGLSRPVDPILLDPKNVVELKARDGTFNALEGGSRVDFRDKRLKLGATVKYILVDEDEEQVVGERPQYRFIKKRDLIPILRYYSLEDVHKYGIVLIAWKKLSKRKL